MGNPLALDNYRLLGNSGLRVSPLCLGTMTFGTEWGFGAEKDDEPRGFSRPTAEAGGNFVDTAINYNLGTSEDMVGRFMEGKRDYYVLATKFTFGMQEKDPNSGGNHRKNIMRSVEASLKRLRTDHIDLYWLHVWEYRTPVEEVMRAVDDLVRQGKILYFGFSDTPAWVVSRGNTMAELRGWSSSVALQIEYSLIERTVEPELIGMARKMNLAVTPWGPLGGGVLTGKYLGNPQGEGEGTRAGSNTRLGRINERSNAIAREVLAVAKETGRTASQVALNWLLQKPGVTSPILGARTIEQLEDNLGAGEFMLGPEHMQRLDEISAVDLPFPHSFIAREGVQQSIAAKTVIEQELPY